MADFHFIDRLTQTYIDKGYFPSAVVSVFDSHKTLYRKAYGDNPAQGGKGRAKVDTYTAYDMASCTKIATATQILDLIDRGKLSLDTKIPDILTDIRSHKDLYSRTRAVTIEQLLTHTSGIRDWYPFYTQQGVDFYDVFESFIGKRPPETQMVYSDMNFMLLGKAVETIKDKELKDCQEDLKKALGASRMDFRPQDFENTAPSCYGNEIEEGMVKDEGLTFDGWRDKTKPTWGVNDGNSHYFFNDTAGHAGIIADVDSYERLCRFYMTTDRPIFIEAQKPRVADRGLGFQTGPKLYPDGGCGHTGFSGTWFWMSRRDDLGVVALTNRLAYPHSNPNSTSDFRHELAYAVFDALKG
jgi:CubicO group peptidase (beta-lactamase class C family)